MTTDPGEKWIDFKETVKPFAVFSSHILVISLQRVCFFKSWTSKSWRRFLQALQSQKPATFSNIGRWEQFQKLWYTARHHSSRTLPQTFIHVPSDPQNLPSCASSESMSSGSMLLVPSRVLCRSLILEHPCWNTYVYYIWLYMYFHSSFILTPPVH